MADPYWRYSAETGRSSWGANDSRGASSEFLQNDILQYRPGVYGLHNVGGIGTHYTPGLSGFTTGTSGFSTGTSVGALSTSLEDPTSINQRSDEGVGGSLKNVDGVLADESRMLFVDGLPTDCTRREVSHLFRPFIGFKDIKVVHKEPRRAGDKALVLCFVEFMDAKYAATALDALQGI
ncbi:RNA-binding protein 2 [Amborella trichopoda]|uniref:RRM domain-containing protein n=1 Tax=Amborella trichopoda TaxID=13333 RepID=W1PAZ0_AMBTC|nr:RNA-binding protein 2 [Amborella trichopoda]ERN04864.1 hypothetical protein AMTR_s00146p00086180 [Amborella trichopoda]|eukprot:XP_006843189.1 RNA-binding protein 2 [Amborella trichopoda]